MVGNVADSFLVKEINASKQRLNNDGCILDKPEKVAEYLAKELYSKVDGMALENARSVRAQCR